MSQATYAFLFDLSQQGIKLWVEGDRLRCNAPKQALTPDLQAQLTERKVDIMQFLRQAETSDSRASGPSETAAQALPTIVPRPEERYQPFPLTDIQQAYWIGRAQAFELSQVSTHFYLEVEGGDIDLARFNRAWQQLIERHEMLRAIVRPDGQQQILEQVPAYAVQGLDLRGESAEKTVAQLAEIRDRMSHQVHPSDQWPLFEIFAVYYDPHLLEQPQSPAASSRTDLLSPSPLPPLSPSPSPEKNLPTKHHPSQRKTPPSQLRIHISYDLLTSDARSIEIVFRELGQLMQQPETPLPSIDLSFRDYVLAEISLQNSAAYRRSQAYWQQRLTTLPPSPELPLVAKLAEVTAPRFDRHHATLAPDTWQRLKTKAAQIGITPSALLLTAFAEILTVWSKSPSFTLNLTLFNRLPLHPQVNHLVGDFTSLTLLAVDHAEARSFTARARQLQKQLWADLEHRQYSGVQVLRDLARVQGEGATPLMPVVFTSILNPEASADRDFPLDWLGDVVYAVSQTPQVYLDHQVSEVSGGLVLTWDVLSAVFPAGLIEAMFAAYCNFLHRLADQDELWESPQRQLLPPAQIQQIEAINATDVSFTTNSPAPLLHTLFFDQVTQRPGQVAIAAPHRSLTYQALCDLTHHLSQTLHQFGICPQDRVAIVMEKGWEQVVAALGILTAGAVYIPIDPALPPERQWQLLEEADVKCILTQSWVEARLTWPQSLQCLSVDILHASADAMYQDTMYQDAMYRVATGDPTRLAYILYTSGSTGMPKGVMIDHRGAVNTILDINQRFGVTPTDRVLALSSLSFDLSVYDIFGVLAAGGTLVIPTATATRDPAHWLELIERHQVTLWNSVPALMQMLVEYARGQANHQPLGAMQSLRLALLSGDWLPLSLPDQIRALATQAQVISLGGATEASIWSILYPIEQIDPAWTSIPYGRPMANQRFYVLDEALEPCPIWVTGQLYIGGVGLAQGYWRNPDKTAASFILHPHRQERLYKTGDLGRYLPDGTIEFLGREDFQVKVNGHRIELGEIEATLLQHAAVRQAIATTVGKTRENRQLVAYVVADLPGQETSSGAAQAQPEAQEPAALADTLVDPAERLAFKLQQRGVRSQLPTQHSISLPKPELDEKFTQAYWQRQSYRQFLAHPISIDAFSRMLSSLLQISGEGLPLPKYRYASAGNLYPVQAYLYVQPDRVEGLTAGFYYYHPVEHQLILLSDFANVDHQIYGINQAVFSGSAFSLFFIGQLQAITPMYGELARDFCLLEAGYMGQLLMEAAPQQEIGLCPIGTLAFEGLREHFCLEPSHVLLHSFVGGKIDPAWTKTAPSNFVKDEAPAASVPQDSAEKPQVHETAGDLRLELSTFIRQKLPSYLVPSAYVFLEAFPLTANGKIDRKALPVPEGLERSNPPAMQPQTPSEQIIASIWQEILQLEAVGLHDNFFELGGNSLLMIRTQVKLQETFKQDIPIVELFKAPTVYALGQYLISQQTFNQQSGQQTPAESVAEKGDKRAQLRSDRQSLRDQRKQSRQMHRASRPS